ncbi:hypothetical protein KPL78_06735 [Roseomonas sp. HJA6]|uniref:Polysaccharide chain length determinant N-terminal domain-containing protein n=1 Tax=Roseomonas alba TaxID=2846776 RepID=A0ABS7A8N4_9PROT|nr:XrtA system polysaccharide chain length determinant [Neoroseomonas alba]MBW6397534.1 hypothetical protein [Neoroseomonas alba]
MRPLDLLRRWIAAGWRFRWQAAAVVWLIALVGWTGVRMIPDRYTSTARIYADADAVLGMLLRGIAIDSSPAAQVDVLQRTLLSRPNLDRLVNRSQLAHRGGPGEDAESLVRTLTANLKFATQGRNLFTIEYRDRDPEVAQDVVQKVVDLFFELASVSDRRQMENARAFLLQQLQVYEQQLREAERRRAEFTTRYQDLLSLDGSASRLESLRRRKEALRGELTDAISRRDLLHGQIAALPEETPGTSSSAAVAEAQQRLLILRQRYTEQHPEVAAASAALAAARATASRSGSGQAAPRANPMREQLLVRYVEAEAQIASLERQIRDTESENERLEEMSRNAPEVQAQFANLDRDYNVLRRNYEELLARREAVNIAEAARTGSDRVTLEVVDPPTLPIRPSGPNRMLYAAAVLLAALGAGAALIFVRIQLDTSFYSLRELQQIGLPVLGAFTTASPRLAVGDLLLFILCLLPLPLVFLVVAIGPHNLIARFTA